MDYAKEVRAFVINNFLFGNAASIQDDTSFLDSGIIDSTGMLELITFIENTYRIEVKPEEMVPENLDSVNKAAQFIARKLTPIPTA